MVALLQTLLDIILLRKGPDAIPYSWILCLLTLTLWLFSGFSMMLLSEGLDDQDFLVGIIRVSFDRCDTADRQQNDAARADAEATSGQRVPELVQDHAEEQGQYEGHAVEDRGQRSFQLPVAQRDPQDQDDEGDVKIDFDVRHPCNFPGPLHARSR